jgi:GNAT superfamily N-acetyltransferase
MPVSVACLTGGDAAKYLDDVARLRIRIFRDFPYLYDGDLTYEEEYLGRYLQAPNFALILVRDGDTVVGASTCLPLSQEIYEIHLPLVGAGYKADNIIYLGESVLDKKYRGQGIGKAFFQEREAHGQRLKKSLASFCAVERPTTHPLCPQAYLPLDVFWQKQGYQKLPKVQTTLSWKDVDQPRETNKQLTFWIKKL